MNKKLIAAAIAASFAAPMAASADVTVYGLAQLEIQNTDVSQAAGVTTDSSTTALTDNKNSRVGVKWSEDLGGGMKAVGEMEFGPNWLDGATANSTTSGAQDSGLYARQANLGLAGDFGEVRFGTNLQPYKYSGGVKYDAFVATAGEARSNNGGMLASHFGQGGYFANSISWKKDFGNVNVWLATSIDGNSDASNKYKGSKGDVMASVVVGLGKGAEVGVAMAKDAYNTGTSGADGEKNAKIFGKYTFGPHQIVAQIESSDVTAANSDQDVKFLGYRFTMGKNMFVAQLGETDVDGTGTDRSYKAIGAIHNFSKSTRAFVLYRSTDLDNTSGAGDTTAISIGMGTKF